MSTATRQAAASALPFVFSQVRTIDRQRARARITASTRRGRNLGPRGAEAAIRSTWWVVHDLTIPAGLRVHWQGEVRTLAEPLSFVDCAAAGPLYSRRQARKARDTLRSRGQQGMRIVRWCATHPSAVHDRPGSLLAPPVFVSAQPEGM